MKIFRGTSGIKDTVDPVRLITSKDTGLTEIAEAINVDIDDSGRISRRDGMTRIAAGVFHSLFCDGGDCFVALDSGGSTSIYKVGTNSALTGVRSGMTLASRIGWCQVGTKTYYGNGTENGYILAAASYPWAAQTYVGPPTTRTFSAPPVGTHFALLSSRLYVVRGNIVTYSEPLGYGLYDMARARLRFASNVKMFKPVAGGIFASDSEKTYFLEGLNPVEFTRRQVLDVPAHEYSEAIGHIDGSLFGLDNAGMCAVWSCDKGRCVGTATGQVIVATKDKLVYPAGTIGASLIDGNSVINTIGGSQCIRPNLRGMASSRYQSYGFNSLARFNGKLYGAKSDGLYEINTGDTDNGTVISSSFTLPTSDFGNQKKKHFRFIYFGGSADGRIKFDLSAEGHDTTITKSYTVTFPRTGQQRIRQAISREIYGRYLTPTLSNVLGSDFSVDEIEIVSPSAGRAG